VSQPPALENLVRPASDADIRALAALLREAIASGAAVSFLDTLTREQAEAWWRETIDHAHQRAIFLVARRGGEIVGTVQIHPARAPNQPHHGDLAKLLVRRDHQRAGLATALMQAAEDAARAAGMHLVVLDAKRGGAAESLYRRLGWTHAGTIPRFALDPDGREYHDAVIFYKHL